MVESEPPLTSVLFICDTCENLAYIHPIIGGEFYDCESDQHFFFKQFLENALIKKVLENKLGMKFIYKCDIFM